MEHDIDDCGVIRAGKERYAPWPDFRPLGCRKKEGLWRCLHLGEVLSSDELVGAAWRSNMPVGVLRELLRFPEGHAELIELAQIHPNRFVQLSACNPALTLIIAAFWALPKWKRMPSRSARDAVRSSQLERRRRDVLEHVGLPATNAAVRILEKIPAEECRLHLLRRMIPALRCPHRRRRLAHLDSINSEVLWLLEAEGPVLDAGILSLAAREPERDGVPLRSVVGRILGHRQVRTLRPFWPFSNQIKTWEALYAAEVRNARKCEQYPERLPRPPIETSELMLPLGLQIHPLRTRTQLIREGDEMQNCAAAYWKDVMFGEAYLYKIVEPERSTLLLEKQRGGWVIDQAMTAANEREVSPATMGLLEEWMIAAKRLRELKIP